MITDNVKDFIVIFNKCDNRTKNEVLDSLFALSNYIESNKDSIKNCTLNNLYATKLFTNLYNRNYSFHQMIDGITLDNDEYRKKLFIVFNMLNTFYGGNKQERENLLNLLSINNHSSMLRYIKRIFTHINF